MAATHKIVDTASASHQPLEWGKCGLSDFDHGIVVGARRAGLSISMTI